MALAHLVGTSVISRLGRAEVRAVVEPHAQAGRLGRAGTTDLEVGYGSGNAAEWDQDMADLSVFELVGTTADHLRRARQVPCLLASVSQRGRKVPDLLVAAAEGASLILLHFDHDFDLIARVTGQRRQWAVPAGAID